MDGFFVALLSVLYIALRMYWWVLLISVIMSWLVNFNVINPRNQFVAMIGNVVYRLTEPVLAPIRRRLPDLGGIDISPIIVILVIYFLQTWISRTMMEI